MADMTIARSFTEPIDLMKLESGEYRCWTWDSDGRVFLEFRVLMLVHGNGARSILVRTPFDDCPGAVTWKHFKDYCCGWADLSSIIAMEKVS